MKRTGTYYFVRRQGAGLANVGNAVKSGAYIAVEGTDKAKLELGDDADPAPTYPMNGLLLDEESSLLHSSCPPSGRAT